MLYGRFLKRVFETDRQAKNTQRDIERLGVQREKKDSKWAMAPEAADFFKTYSREFAIYQSATSLPLTGWECSWTRGSPGMAHLLC